MRAVLFLLLLAAGALRAEPIGPIEPLKPFAFWAGHCWKGEFPNGKQTDEHCFQWMYDGQALRDVHTVRAPGRPDYVGETIYYYDSGARQVQYLYVEAGGGISRGTVTPSASGLAFPAAQYVAAGQPLTYRAQWTPAGEAYEAFSEIYVNDKWVTQFKMLLKRQ